MLKPAYHYWLTGKQIASLMAHLLAMLTQSSTQKRTCISAEVALRPYEAEYGSPLKVHSEPFS